MSFTWLEVGQVICLFLVCLFVFLSKKETLSYSITLITQTRMTFESLGNSPGSSRKQIFRDILEKFSYFSMKMYAVIRIASLRWF